MQRHMVLFEKRWRLVGPLIFFVFDFILIFSELFSWKGSYVILRIIAAAFFHILLIWEPTRFFIVTLRKRWSGLSLAKRRVFYSLLILVPYGFLVGFLRLYLEDVIRLWHMPVLYVSTLTYSIGLSLLYILLELFVYETIYYAEEWAGARQEAEELKRMNFEIRFDFLRSQVQPHFLFNTLNTLIGLIEDEPKQAIRFTEELSSVYRYLLVTNEQPLIGLDEEMEFMRAYNYLLKTRYEEALQIHIDAVKEINRFLIPPLTLQLLVENAVKHNIITSKKPLHIQVQVQPEEETIIVTNQLQPKTAVQSTGKGLMQLKKKFTLLDLPEPIVEHGTTEFSVKVPLVSLNAGGKL
jgi:hypothetical protein